MSNERIVVFDDGSIETKVMQHELKNTYDMTVVPVDKYEDLPTWLDKAIKATEGLFTGIIKIFLHFPFEDYIQKDIRTEIMEATRKNPNLRIIPWYEQAPREGLKIRAVNYGIQPTIIQNKVDKQEVVREQVWDIPDKPKHQLPEEPKKKRRSKTGFI